MAVDRKYVAEDILTALQRYGEQTQRGLLRCVPGAALTVVEVLQELVTAGRVVQRAGKRRSLVYDLAPLQDPDLDVPPTLVRRPCSLHDDTGCSCPENGPSVTPEAVKAREPTLTLVPDSESVPEPAQAFEGAAPDGWWTKSEGLTCQRFVKGKPCGVRVTGTGVWCVTCEQNVRAQLGLGG